MKYFDSSALIRALVAGEKPHGLPRPHSLAEFYGILTGRGVVNTTASGAVKKTFAR